MSKQPKKARILSVVFDPDLGLCVELGDEEVDKEICGYGPKDEFLETVNKEIKFQIGNTIGGCKIHPTLKKVDRRLQKGFAHHRKC